MVIRGIFGAALVAHAMMMSQMALAETLPLNSIYPAGSDRIASIDTLAFAEFSGSEGRSLAFALEQQVRDATIRGKPYFAVLPVSSRPAPDAVIRGDASARVENRREIVQQQKCVSTNAKGKCIERRWVERSCTRRIVTLSYNVAAESPRRERLFSTSSSAADSVLICPDGGDVPAVEVAIDYLVGGVATALRRQFAPFEQREDVRVKEGTEGLQGNAKKSFKEAIKLTKRNAMAACDVWSEVNELVSDHPPTLFNLGLCAESRQSFVDAIALYRRVADLNRSETYATEGIARVELRQKAERQIAMQASNSAAPAPASPTPPRKRKRR